MEAWRAAEGSGSALGPSYSPPSHRSRRPAHVAPRRWAADQLTWLVIQATSGSAAAAGLNAMELQDKLNACGERARWCLLSVGGRVAGQACAALQCAWLPGPSCRSETPPSPLLFPLPRPLIRRPRRQLQRQPAARRGARQLCGHCVVVQHAGGCGGPGGADCQCVSFDHAQLPCLLRLWHCPVPHRTWMADCASRGCM